MKRGLDFFASMEWEKFGNNLIYSSKKRIS